MKLEMIGVGANGWTFVIKPETPEEGWELEHSLVPELKMRFPELHNWIDGAVEEVKRRRLASIM